MVGRRSPQTPSINRLTSLPDSVLSKRRRSRHAKFQHIRRRHPSIWQDSHFSDGEAGMGLPRSNDGEARFSAYVEGLTSVIGHADRTKPLAQERGADGSDHSARTDRSSASVAAAFYRRGKMVGREGSR